MSLSTFTAFLPEWVLLGGALIYNAVRGRRRLWPPLAIGVWVVALIIFLAIVPAVPITPIRLFRVWRTAAAAPGSITPSTGISRSARRASSA